MRIMVRWLPRDEGGPKALDLPEEATGEALLKALSVHPDTVVLTRQRSPIPHTAPLSHGDEIAVIRVASGG